MKRAIGRRLLCICILGILLSSCSVLVLFFSMSIQMTINYLKGLAAVFLLLWGLDIIARVRRGKWLISLQSLKKTVKLTGAAVAAVFISLAGLILAGLYYREPDTFSADTSFFRDKEVLVFVPHQDDEINLAGGIIEQYISCGSRVDIVFSTNGDYNDLAEIRFSEALEAAAVMGVEEENVHFLGFGDQWIPRDEKGHIYHSRNADDLWTSHNGRTGTYGTSAAQCYQDCAYTRENYLKCIKEMILQLSPDVIYCVDYDSHSDHRALDLLFEEAMGQILSENSRYKPTVYKGFCYSTAWYAPEDYLASVNLESTKEPSEETWRENGGIYSWTERVRLPLAGDNLNPMLANTTVFSALEKHRSANAYLQAERVLNGDKVFWLRRCSSVLYDAEFFSGGQQIFLWNDFKLKDSFDIMKKGAPWDCVALAEEIYAVLAKPAAVNQIVLYDHPDPGKNILSGCIRLDTGFEAAFDRRNRAGETIVVDIPEQIVSEMQIIITETEGERPGLSEIEAYCVNPETAREDGFVMMMDEAGNFVYNYRIEEGDRAVLKLYASPAEQKWNLSSADISIDGDEGCGFGVYEDQLVVTCPEGKTARISISFEDGPGVSFAVTNPGKWEAANLRMLQKVNKHFAFSCAALRSFVLELKIRYLL